MRVAAFGLLVVLAACSSKNPNDVSDWEKANEGVLQTQESANELDVLAGRVDELVGAFRF